MMGIGRLLAPLISPQGVNDDDDDYVDDLHHDDHERDVKRS